MENNNEWLDMLIEGKHTSKKIMEVTLENMINDTRELVKTQYADEITIKESVAEFISTYTMVILYFQHKEEFEHCAEIKKHILSIMKNLYGSDNENINELLISGIGIYNNLGLKFN